MGRSNGNRAARKTEIKKEMRITEAYLIHYLNFAQFCGYVSNLSITLGKQIVGGNLY